MFSSPENRVIGILKEYCLNVNPWRQKAHQWLPGMGGAEGNGGAGGNGEHLLNASGFLLGVRKRFGSRQERVP